VAVKVKIWFVDVAGGEIAKLAMVRGGIEKVYVLECPGYIPTVLPTLSSTVSPCTIMTLRTRPKWSAGLRSVKVTLFCPFTTKLLMSKGPNFTHLLL